MPRNGVCPGPNHSGIKSHLRYRASRLIGYRGRFWDFLGFFVFFGFWDFLDPASVLEVSDMALLIAEVWDFYLLLNASFFPIINVCFFIDFSLLSSPCYSLSSPGAPPDRQKKLDFFSILLINLSWIA